MARRRRRIRRRRVLLAAVLAGLVYVQRSAVDDLILSLYTTTPVQQTIAWAETWLPRAWLLVTAAGAAYAYALGSRLAGKEPAWVARLRGPDLPQLDELNADDTGQLLEATAARLLTRDGCDVKTSHGGGGDLGRDGLAIGPDGQRIVAQCKAYDQPVGSPDLQRFNGTCWAEHGADIALFVTTSTFTGPARLFARRHNITLVDGRRLVAWLDGAWSPISPPRIVWPAA